MTGKITVKKPSREELNSLNTKAWSPWSCKESVFDWEYSEEEICYILDGVVEVETEDGEKVEIVKGDLVTFPKGLKCVWNVKEAVSKLYNFR